MNRQEFMAQLTRLLSDIDEQERREAIDYYNSYFDDAGVENEAAVIQELGSPGKVAAMIKADLGQDGSRHGEYTDTGYEDERFREARQMPESSKRQQERYQGRKRRGAGSWALIIILIVFTSPLWLGLGGGLLGLVFGLLAGLFGIIISVCAMAFGFVFGGAALIIDGVIGIFANPATGLVTFGSGMLLLAIGILCVLLAGWVFVKWLPGLFRFCVDLAQRVLHRGRGGDRA